MRPPPSELADRHAAGTDRGSDPSVLPPGFTVRLGADTRVCDDGRTLVGGSGAVLHLRPRARAMLHDGTLVCQDADSATVARLLLDSRTRCSARPRGTRTSPT